MICLNCSSKTENPKYCSRRCAAIYSNRANPKRKLTRICLSCPNIVKSYRHRRCITCQAIVDKEKERIRSAKTIGDYRSLDRQNGTKGPWKNAHIRLLARQQYADLTIKPCKKCGYDKHVELCHIKPIRSFPDSALISEVNAPDNIIQLCPNCHWELDNLVDLSGIAPELQVS